MPMNYRWQTSMRVLWGAWAVYGWRLLVCAFRDHRWSEEKDPLAAYRGQVSVSALGQKYRECYRCGARRYV